MKLLTFFGLCTLYLHGDIVEIMKEYEDYSMTEDAETELDSDDLETSLDVEDPDEIQDVTHQGILEFSDEISENDRDDTDDEIQDEKNFSIPDEIFVISYNDDLEEGDEEPLSNNNQDAQDRPRKPYSSIEDQPFHFANKIFVKTVTVESFKSSRNQTEAFEGHKRGWL